ncbi:uncharacterized protein LOC111294912 [Durio zibethinus]|uniref:Uncharacterized protein LOC111294912 n=1 Tax=Durio zibethinus TaxID=66656 RepID=A0A6P5YTX8_DURZI|nr:uncharacterized protein LOC111294912 [Durio zibethinus]
MCLFVLRSYVKFIYRLGSSLRSALFILLNVLLNACWIWEFHLKQTDHPYSAFWLLLYLKIGGFKLTYVNHNLDIFVVSDELAAAHGFLGTPELVREVTSGLGSKDPNFKWKNVMGSEQVVNPGYFVSFPEDVVKQKSTQEFSSSIAESISKQEDIRSMGFDATAGVFSFSNELWGNLKSYGIPELGVTGGLSDVWYLGFLQATEDSGTDKWPAEESPYDNPDTQSQAGQPQDNRSQIHKGSFAFADDDLADHSYLQLLG